MYACILIFFVTNMIEGQLISTGAFEVSLNGMYIQLWLKNIYISYETILFKTFKDDLQSALPRVCLRYLF